MFRNLMNTLAAWFRGRGKLVAACRTAAVGVSLLLVVSGVALGECDNDDDVKTFLVQRDSYERLLIQSWLNDQIDEQKIAALSGEIAAWEARILRICEDDEFLSKHLRLLKLQNLTVLSLPARLLIATMDRAGILETSDRPWLKRRFDIYPRRAR